MANRTRIASGQQPGEVEKCDRVAGETSKAYQAFAAYRDLPIDERSLTRVSQMLGKSRSLCARWSGRFRWSERVQESDREQQELRRKRAEAERDKIYERQLQHNRIASQALMASLIALAKRAQTGGNVFAGTSDADLARIAALAARALPRVHEDERTLAQIPEQQKQAEPTTIVGAEFRWVQSACVCGHGWDSHNQLEAICEHDGRLRCTAAGCQCTDFKESDLTSD